ncbi:hypothetical protein ACFXO9_26640 [Nocardia tengchongensis]|uniref:hypothetical protein n=1 Tax=Nocardia tengchongensis TaxID=2055889 RepID=UPI0036753E5F
MIDVAVLAEHAMAAPEHAAFALDPDETPVPSLLFVADDGMYLMSNGRPRLLADPTEPDGPSRIVHSQNPNSDATPLLDDGAIDDDILERIDLTAQFTPTDQTIDLIRKFAVSGGWLVLTITSTRFDVSFAPSKSA